MAIELPGRCTGPVRFAIRQRRLFEFRNLSESDLRDERGVSRRRDSNAPDLRARVDGVTELVYCND